MLKSKKGAHRLVETQIHSDTVSDKSSSFLFCHFRAMLSKGCAIHFAPYT